MDIEAILRKHEDALMAYPNVTAVGVGERAGHAVIKVMVVKKVSESSLRSQDVLPKELDGCRIDVEEIGEITAH